MQKLYAMLQESFRTFRDWLPDRETWQAVLDVLADVCKWYFIAVSVLTLIVCLCSLLWGCAGPRPVSKIEECLTDPERNALYCNGKTIPWPEASQYVCHKLSDHEAWFAGCSP